MRLVRILIAVTGMFALAVSCFGEQKSLGIRDEYQITFVEPIRVGTTLLPAGDYVIRHAMEGQDHIMTFHPVRGKAAEVRVRCTLVPLSTKADKTLTIYELNAANERVLQELIFKGDTAKHVF